MFRSLRFRLPAVFLAGIVVAGLVSTAIALRLFQNYVSNQAYAELGREAASLTELYSETQALRVRRIERESAARLYYVPRPGVLASLYNTAPGEPDLPTLPRSLID